MARLTLLLGGLFALCVVAMALPRTASAAVLPVGQTQALQLPNLTEEARFYRRRFIRQRVYARPRFYRPAYVRPRTYARPRFTGPRVVCRIRHTAWGAKRICVRRW